MKSLPLSGLAAAAVMTCSLLPSQAGAVTQAVIFDALNASATLPTPLSAGDNLVLDTLVTSEVGALLQSITFTVGAGVNALTGFAAWQISTATGTGPRLIGVNIDLFDATDTLVDQRRLRRHVGRVCCIPPSTAAIGPGTYKLVATGTGVRDSSLDLSLEFTGAVPEPATYALMLVGIAATATLTRRRGRSGRNCESSPQSWR